MPDLPAVFVTVSGKTVGVFTMFAKTILFIDSRIAGDEALIAGLDAKLPEVQVL